jgi:flagella synthesis protein FlgN
MGKTIPAAATANFISHLHAERDALRAFVTLLETEQQALLSGQTEQLPPLSESKIQAAQELNKLENMRRNELLAHGVAIETESINIWMQLHARESLPIWSEIQQLAARAQQLNLNNGTLIQTRLRHNQQALTVLHNAANSAHGLYGPDGQPHHPTSGRTLGSV